MDGWTDGWLVGWYPGGRGYRAPYGANNIYINSQKKVKVIMIVVLSAQVVTSLNGIYTVLLQANQFHIQIKIHFHFHWQSPIIAEWEVALAVFDNFLQQ